MIFYRQNMNPSNTFPWVKLILTHEYIPTHLMNYTCALCPKAMMWIIYWCKLIQLDEIHCRRIKQLNKISCCFKMKYVSSMKMHSKFILSTKFYINSINENAHNLFRGFLLMNGGTFIHFSCDGSLWYSKVQ
jgi:hypothetical protein